MGSFVYGAHGSGFRKVIFADQTEGALEVFGEIFPLGSGGDSSVRIAQLLVVFPAANVAYIFLHKIILLNVQR